MLKTIPGSRLSKIAVATRASVAAVGCVLFVLTATSCAIERIFPDPVGAAIARLTVRNAAIIVVATSADETCGFASERVKRNPIVEGEIGSVGVYTLVVDDCDISFSELAAVSESCVGDVNAASGTVVVSARQRVEGLLTGDPGNPVIPLGSEAATITVSVRFNDFEVRSSGADNSLRIVEGSADYTVRPRLAVDDGNGICSKIGSNIFIEHFGYTVGSKLHVTNGTQEFDVPVDASDISAQLGLYDDLENHLEGTVRVWDVDVVVPEAHEKNELDPDYDRETFLDGYRCMEGLRLPVSYVCEDLSPTFGVGAGQLAMRDFGGVMATIEADTSCGFSSPSVLNSVVVEGELGLPGGRATYQLDGACELNYTTPFIVSENCRGEAVTIQGIARVRGTKTLEGIRTGAADQPIVPTSSSPAVFNLEIEYIDFVAKSSISTQSLLIRSGTISGQGKPRTGMDLSLGACSIVTPHLEFSGIRIQNVDSLLRNADLTVSLFINDSDLLAVNGTVDGHTNYLDGRIVVNGTEVILDGEDEGTTLDPSYDPAAFFESFSCDENLYLPEDDAECNFDRILGEGAARLIVQSVGTVAGLINSDAGCGFADLLGQIQPSEVVGEPGEIGSMRWDVEGCVLGNDTLEVFGEDCVGGQTFLEGVADINASRIVRGERESILVAIDSIKPLDSTSVDVLLDNVTLTNFSSYSIAAGKDAPAGELRIDTGTLDAVVHPALGEMVSDPGRFMIPTPVAVMEEVRLTNATTTLHTGGMTFSLTIDDARLFATNGSAGGSTNMLEGYVVINGTRVDISPIALNPDYSKAAFDAGYSCTEDLVSVLP